MGSGSGLVAIVSQWSVDALFSFLKPRHLQALQNFEISQLMKFQSCLKSQSPF